MCVGGSLSWLILLWKKPFFVTLVFFRSTASFQRSLFFKSAIRLLMMLCGRKKAKNHMEKLCFSLISVNNVNFVVFCLKWNSAETYKVPIKLLHWSWCICVGWTVSVCIVHNNRNKKKAKTNRKRIKIEQKIQDNAIAGAMVRNW